MYIIIIICMVVLHYYEENHLCVILLIIVAIYNTGSVHGEDLLLLLHCYKLVFSATETSHIL